MIDRARFARTIDVAGAEEPARTLFDVARGEEPALDRAVAGWVEARLLPALARARLRRPGPPGDPETTVLRAMAGDRLEGREGLALFEWEGLWYRADPGRAEFARLERVRPHQGGESLGDALRSCRSVADARDAPPCRLAPVLTSLVYAAHVGEPDGPALAGEDVSRRHDFGREPWDLPEEVAGPGVPWHVRGSLLGLERALARLLPRRLAGDDLPEAPPVVEPACSGGWRSRWPSPIAASCPTQDRDALAATIESGRMPGGVASGGRCGRRGRRRATPGSSPGGRGPSSGCSSTSPTPAPASSPSGSCCASARRPTADGTRGACRTSSSAACSHACPIRFPLDESAGREPEPAVAERFVDLALRVAEHLAERRLPASLAPAVASALLPDLFAEARPLALDDRHGLDAWVRALPRERLDDAVASLVGRGPLQPAAGPGGHEVKARALAALAGLALVAPAPGGDPAAPASVVIEEPAPGRYVSGLVTLRARVEPAGLPVLRLVFAADGQPVCSREAPPWECAWDAGTGVVGPQHPCRGAAHRRLAPRGLGADRGLRPSPRRWRWRSSRWRPRSPTRSGRLVKGLRPGGLPGVRGRPAAGGHPLHRLRRRSASSWWRWT